MVGHDWNLSMTPHPPLLLIGCGKMGGAILKGLRANPAKAPEEIIVVDPQAPAIPGVTVLGGLSEVASFPHGVVVLAVKPGLIPAVLESLRRFVNAEVLFISIAAGVGLATLEAGLGGSASVVRAMPNTPAAVLQGMTAAAAGRCVSMGQRETCDRFLRAVGDVAWLDDEALIDVATALSGSGPAYFFRLAEALAKAGEAAGLPGPIAKQLARRTLEGAGALAATSAETLADLRTNVTSPSGTTAAGLAVMDEGDAMDRLAQAVVNAAASRSRELGKG